MGPRQSRRSPAGHFATRPDAVARLPHGLGTGPDNERGTAAGRGRGPRLRRPISVTAAVFFAALSIVLFFLLWWLLTAGRDERTADHESDVAAQSA